MNRAAVAALAGMGAVLLAGCTAMQGSGPRMDNASSVTTEALPFDVVDLTPQSVIAFRPEPLPARVAPVSAAPPAFTVGPDDVLKINIVERYAGGIFATLQQSNTLVVTRRVGADGMIEVPFVGAVAATGHDLRQIETDIIARLAGKANDPQVMIEIEANRSNTVTVSGDVARPGRLSLTEGSTVVDAINNAGGLMLITPPAKPGAPAAGAEEGGGGGARGLGGYGLSTSPIALNRSTISSTPKTLGDQSQMRVVVRRQGRVMFDKPYSQVLTTGDFALQKGDEIVVSPNSQVVTILGAVLKSGNLPIVKPDMTLADALGDSAGLIDPAANRTGIYVFRAPGSAFNAGERGRIFRLDMAQPVSVFVARQFAVHPHDVIYVSNAPLYEFDKMLTPIYRTLYAVSAARHP